MNNINHSSLMLFKGRKISFFWIPKNGFISLANKIFFPPSCVLNYFQCKCNYSCRTLLPRYMKCQQSKHIFHTQTMEMMNKAITLPTYVTLPYSIHTTHIRVRHSESIVISNRTLWTNPFSHHKNTIQWFMFPPKATSLLENL